MHRLLLCAKSMTQNADYENIGINLINELEEFKDIRESDVMIAFLSSEKEKKQNHKTIYGECIKVDNNYKWICPYDFMIILYEPNIADFNDKQIETLIRHELHHIGIDYTDKGLKYYIVPHDIEEFWEIIADCGLDWSK